MSEEEGLTHAEFMALSGLAPMPNVPVNSRPLPVEFAVAVRAIIACQTINDAKTWANKSDALAAWAKVYADDQVGREARILKLHAYRRIGELAQGIAPAARVGAYGRNPGPRSVLTDHGFTNHQADAIRKLSIVPVAEFKKLTEARKPSSPLTLAATALRANPSFAEYARRLHSLLAIARATSPADLAASLNDKQSERMMEDADELCTWLEQFKDQLLRASQAA